MNIRAEVIETYIQSKDCNRPWMMPRVFSGDARLEIENRSEAISFPSTAVGVEEISELLVRQFACENENVYTICLSPAPIGHGGQFSCIWLVAMSRRNTGEIRVGVGHYNWEFAQNLNGLATDLKITIDAMVVLEKEYTASVMTWISGLPYPWCSVSAAQTDIPDLADLKPISDFLHETSNH